MRDCDVQLGCVAKSTPEKASLGDLTLGIWQAISHCARVGVEKYYGRFGPVFSLSARAQILSAITL
eukprot:SAG31_NODE_866_length_11370_cov_4.806761_8_plen_66_part_00